MMKPATDARDVRIGRRVRNLAAGLCLYGLGIALLVSAGLGLDSWDVLHQALSRRFDLSFGTIVNAVAIVALLLWIPLAQRPGPGTAANALLVGPFADVFIAIVPEPHSLVARGVLLVAGVGVIGAATGLYIGAGLGPGPRDGLMTGLVARTGASIRLVRTAIEGIVLVAGWALGGTVGPGTVLFAVGIGPATQFFLGRMSLVAHDTRIARAAALEASC